MSGRLKRDVPDAVRRDVMDGAEGCAYCGDVLAGLELDHTIPLARGGTNDRDNLRAVCVACNTQKRSMLEYEWRAYRVQHGMPWPPLASHPLAPEHYKDGHRCDRHPDAAGAQYGVMYKVHVPYEMVVSGRGGYKCYYSCEFGHVWTCWYAIQFGYFSDCICAYCTHARGVSGMGEKYVDDAAAHLHWRAY